MVPTWVMVMCNTMFFGSCSSHANNVNAKRNNIIVDRFCIDCAKPLCSDCLLHEEEHQSHNHVKIRRYIYNDVIKKQDLSKIFDCHDIQTYHTNKAKVIFLKQRRSEQQVQEKEQTYCNNRKECCWCIVCAKSLQDNSLYCSIACKVTGIHRNDGKKEIDDVVENGKRTMKSLVCKKWRPKGRRKGFPQRAPMF